MVKRGDQITNARTGQIMIFHKTAAETDGELLEIECFSPPTAVKEPEHIHPLQENIFKIISGSCVFKVEGEEQIVGAGRTISILPKAKHHFWNSGDTVAHYMQEFRPALHIEEFFETFFALSRDEKLNEKGIPNFFHVSLIALKHQDEIRLTKPPWALQLLTYWILAPIGYLIGYRSYYKSKN
jgi:quercetin dioxygenase-like cupin family protein